MSAPTEETKKPDPAPVTVPLTRDEARAKVFGTKAVAQTLTLWGVEVELREPSIGAVIDTQAEEDRKRAAMNMLVRYVFLPDGTPLFEEADIEALLALPFGKDYREVQYAIMRLTGVMPEAADKSITEE